MTTPVPELKWCALCAREGRAVQAEWEIAYASGDTAVVTCTLHFGEAGAMAMHSQSADHIIVYDLSRSL